MANGDTDAILLKVDRADEHIQDVRREIAAYLTDESQMVEVEIPTRLSGMIRCLVPGLPVPLTISPAVGDTVHNLRSALDHLAYSLAQKNVAAAGKIFNDKTQYFFPILESENAYNKARNKTEIQDLGSQVIDCLDALQPYQGGNFFLWAIRVLDNIDKHRFILTCQRSTVGWTESQLTDYASTFIGEEDTRFLLPQVWESENAKNAITIAFEKTGVVDGRLVVPTLREMSKLVRKIITDFAPLL